MAEGQSETSQQLIYRETFDKGAGNWKVGKDKEDGSYNQNVLGKRGEGLPLGWSARGGAAVGFAIASHPGILIPTMENSCGFTWFWLVPPGKPGLPMARISAT